MRRHFLAILVGLAALAGCDRAADRPGAAGQVFAPGVAGEAEEDGLIVGDRLMAAGEFELALRAYGRAAAERGLDADTLSALGSANLRLGRLNQAEELLRRAVEEDPAFAPAWNNLGVTLMEQGRFPEARQAFRRAFATSNGQSVEIRDNLRLAIAKGEDPGYEEENDNEFRLVRRGTGDVLLSRTP